MCIRVHPWFSPTKRASRRGREADGAYWQRFSSRTRSLRNSKQNAIGGSSYHDSANGVIQKAADGPLSAEGDGALLGTQDPAAVDMHHLAGDPITGGRA